MGMEEPSLNETGSFGECSMTARKRNEIGQQRFDARRYAEAQPLQESAAAAHLVEKGMALIDPTVSQETDAADTFRRALALKPDQARAKEGLDIAKRKLVPLAERARIAATGLVRPADWFKCYISPYESLQIEEALAGVELDAKAIQRAKRRLLQELDLNEGKVSWLDNYPLDKSRAHKLDDELLDPKKVRYHRAIFQNKHLLRFLTRGHIEHFLYSDDYFPQATLDLLDEEPEFRAFLSKPFAQQYNRVLTRAIEQRLQLVIEVLFFGRRQRRLPVIEALFGGRRWVMPEDDDVCFEGADRRIRELVELVRSKATEGRARKVTLGEIEDVLREHTISELFGLLPAAFRTHQIDLVTALRVLAISCFNEHGDAELAKNVFDICKRLPCRSVELNKKLEDDVKDVERIIAEERKHENQRSQRSFHPSGQCIGWLVFASIVIIIGVFNASGSNKTATHGRTYSPRSAPSVPVYNPIGAELAIERQRIDTEKAKADQMEGRLDGLSREIERERLVLDRTSRFEIDAFNRKVENYNDLLGQLREQERLVNQLIDSYNEKVRKQRR
jgi:hypothetical protein